MALFRYLQLAIIVEFLVGKGEVFSEHPIEPAFQYGRKSHPVKRKLEYYKVGSHDLVLFCFDIFSDAWLGACHAVLVIVVAVIQVLNRIFIRSEDGVGGG